MSLDVKPSSGSNDFLELLQPLFHPDEAMQIELVVTAVSVILAAACVYFNLVPMYRQGHWQMISITSVTLWAIRLMYHQSVIGTCNLAMWLFVYNSIPDMDDD